MYQTKEGGSSAQRLDFYNTVAQPFSGPIYWGIQISGNRGHLHSAQHHPAQRGAAVV